MMIEDTTGNLLDAAVEALVNPVNCVGVMGKGLALQFRHAFPENFRQYITACRAGEVQLGRMFIVPYDQDSGPHYIINFPTKQHWRNRSQLPDIQAGLDDMTAQIVHLTIRSIAIPPLGCGLGGLEWSAVRPLIERAFAALPDVRVLLFVP